MPPTQRARAAAPLEAARGALLAAHAAAGLAGGAEFREAARLLRAAEGLIRSAVAVLAAPPPPEPAAAPPVARPRRRPRRRGRGGARGPAGGSDDAMEAKEDAAAAAAVAGGPAAPSSPLLDDSWADALPPRQAAAPVAPGGGRPPGAARSPLEIAAATKALALRLGVAPGSLPGLFTEAEARASELSDDERDLLYRVAALFEENSGAGGGGSACAQAAAMSRAVTAGGEAWAAASARTLARRLRRERRAQLGQTRAAAMSYRLRGLRVALDAHWRLGDRLGGHIPTLGAAIAAARLAGLDDAELQDTVDALETGNWCRHAPPPCASGMPPLPAAVRAVDLESTLEMMAFPLNAEADPFQPRLPVHPQMRAAAATFLIYIMVTLLMFLLLESLLAIESLLDFERLLVWSLTFVETPLVFVMFLLLIESLLVYTMFLLIEGLLIFVSLLVFESLLAHEILRNSFLIESLLVFKLCLLYLYAFVSTSTSRRRLRRPSLALLLTSLFLVLLGGVLVMPSRTSGSEHLVKLFVRIVDLALSFLALIGGMLGVPRRAPGSEHTLLRAAPACEQNEAARRRSSYSCEQLRAEGFCGGGGSLGSEAQETCRLSCGSGCGLPCRADDATRRRSGWSCQAMFDAGFCGADGGLGVEMEEACHTTCHEALGCLPPCKPDHASRRRSERSCKELFDEGFCGVDGSLGVETRVTCRTTCHGAFACVPPTCVGGGCVLPTTENDADGDQSTTGPGDRAPPTARQQAFSMLAVAVPLGASVVCCCSVGICAMYCRRDSTFTPTVQAHQRQGTGASYSFGRGGGRSVFRGSGGAAAGTASRWTWQPGKSYRARPAEAAQAEPRGRPGSTAGGTAASQTAHAQLVEAEPVDPAWQGAPQQAATADAAQLEPLEDTPAGVAAVSQEAIFLCLGQAEAEGAAEPLPERGAEQPKRKNRVKKKPGPASPSKSAGQGRASDDDGDADVAASNAASPARVGKDVGASAEATAGPADAREAQRVSGAPPSAGRRQAEQQEAVGRRRSLRASIFAGRLDAEGPEGAAQQEATGRRRSTFASIFAGRQDPEGAAQQEATGKRHSTLASIFAGRLDAEDPEGAAQQEATWKRRSTFASMFSGWQAPEDLQGVEQQEATGRRRSTFASMFSDRQAPEGQCGPRRMGFAYEVSIADLGSGTAMEHRGILDRHGEELPVAERLLREEMRKVDSRLEQQREGLEELGAAQRKQDAELAHGAQRLEEETGKLRRDLEHFQEDLQGLKETRIECTAHSRSLKELAQKCNFLEEVYEGVNARQLESAAEVRAARSAGEAAGQESKRSAKELRQQLRDATQPIVGLAVRMKDAEDAIRSTKCDLLSQTAHIKEHLTPIQSGIDELRARQDVHAEAHERLAKQQLEVRQLAEGIPPRIDELVSRVRLSEGVAAGWQEELEPVRDKVKSLEVSFAQVRCDVEAPAGSVRPTESTWGQHILPTTGCARARGARGAERLSERMPCSWNTEQRSDAAKQCSILTQHDWRHKLSQLCIAQCDAELSRVRHQLEVLSARTAESARRREELEAAEQRRREARKAVKEDVRFHKFVDAGLCPSQGALCLAEAHAFALAAASRKSMHDGLLPSGGPEAMAELRHGVQQVQVQSRAATALQAWWRGALARRVCAVLRLHGRLLAVYRRMEGAAVVVQARQRGVYARIFCRRSEEQRRERLRLEQEAAERWLQAARRIQAASRAARARRQLQRKAALDSAAEAAAAAQAPGDGGGDAEATATTAAVAASSQALGGASAAAAAPADAAPAAAAQALSGVLGSRVAEARGLVLSLRLERLAGGACRARAGEARHSGLQPRTRVSPRGQQGGRASTAARGVLLAPAAPLRRGHSDSAGPGQAPRRGFGERSALRAERRLAAAAGAGGSRGLARGEEAAGASP
ncbi:unnamed protein product [Prorocentrum cordatum]|uniref:Uncharacterized protein n=1 Tax=Prorocentrum cordatum TaxID=2364126 RepID=A0ABN9W067_9DINO|nr:unnamed protein product [Polarella glacialis]